MRIPSQYIGTWGGKITDVNRVQSYNGEITLSADGVDTGYHMARGQKKGRLTWCCESDGFLVLKENVGSWRGTLMLYMDVGSNLRCVWRDGAEFSSEAAMTRAVPAEV